MPIGLQEITDFMKTYKDIFKYSSTFKTRNAIAWEDVEKIMTDESDWDEDFKDKLGTGFLENSLKSEDYYKYCFLFIVQTM